MNVLKKMKKAMAFLLAAMMLAAAGAYAEDLSALSDEELMTLYTQVTEEIEKRNTATVEEDGETDDTAGETRDAAESVASFMYYWSANRVSDMVTLCSHAWSSQYEDLRMELFRILANRTPISMEIESISGTDQDDSRTVEVRTLIDRNNGREPLWYLLQIRTVKEDDGTWRIDPASLMYAETQPTAEPAADETGKTGGMMLYYNKAGGEYYHLDPNCRRVNEKYLPLKDSFTYDELNDDAYRGLKACRICGAPERPAAGTDECACPYGVFLSITENIEQFADYGTAVIDAQYYSAEEIEGFRNRGHKVYTYLNIGSLEEFRDYYEEYKDLSLGAYEHWEEEVWVDVSQQKWQDLILKDIVPGLIEKGVDGFFVDNCDVYYVHPEEKILDGLSVIMKGLVQTGRKVIINGGDTFLDAYCEKKGNWSEVITGINQESVFSAILWDEEKFGTAEDEDREYFTSYVTRYGDQGAEIYLLEYTTDEELISTIDGFCKEHGYTYYVSDSVELDG